MSAVATLIAQALPVDAVESASRALSRLGADVAPPDWLHAGRACDLAFGRLDPDQADAALRRALAGAAVDIVAQASAGRRKSLLVADMEATIIRNEMLDELAEHLGLGPGIAEVTRRAMAGEIAFDGALRARVALLAGYPERVLDEVATRIEIMPGAAALVATMRAHGARTALVSGGFTVFTGRVRAALGFDEDHANVLEIAAGRLTGQVLAPIRGPEAKLATLAHLAAGASLTLAECVAVGDGANDIPMLRAAGLGVAFRAKPATAAAARVRIDHADLTALLYAQGYRREQIAGT